MNYLSNKSSKRVTHLILLLTFLSILSIFYPYKRENEIDLSQESYSQNLKPIINSAPLYQLEWSRTYSDGDFGIDVELTTSEDIILSGEDGVYNAKMRIVKYNKLGVFQWTKSYDGTGGYITLDSSNNIYLVGFIEDLITDNRDIILRKLNSVGAVQWSKTFDKNQYDLPAAVALDNSNNIYIIGYTYKSSSENKDILLVKYSSSGTLLWDRILDIDEEDYGYEITTDSNYNIYICGSTSPKTTERNDYVAAKYDSNGNLQWSKRWGDWYDEKARDIKLDSFNNIYITGYKDTDPNKEEVSLIKMNNNGNILWTKLWGGSSIDKGYCLDIDADGDIYIGGASYEQSAGMYDVLMLVYDSGGNIKWWGNWGGSDHDIGAGIVVDSAKNVYIGGYYEESLYNDDFCLLKYNPSPKIIINSPLPNQLFSYNSPSFSVDITDSGLLETYYTVNDGSQYVFTGSTGNINQSAWDICPHGTVSLKFFGRDNVGAVYEEVIVRKDIIAPDFEIFAPTINQVCTDTAPNYQLSTSDTDVNSIWYTLNGGGNIFTSSLTGNIDQTSWNTLDNGSVLIEFYLEDDIGNIAFKSVEVYKNYEIPLVSITSPFPNHIYGLAAPNYDISTSSLWSIDEMWYSLNSGENNTISEIEGFIEQSKWDLCGNGTVSITFYARNSLGNVGNATVTVWKDIYYPFINIYQPLTNEKYGISPPYYNVSITSTTLDSKLYSLNSVSEVHFLDDVGTINKDAWDACGNGTVIITFYANNSGGITNSKEVTIYKDVRRPNITIISPTPGILCGLETIDFDISIDDPQLDNTWYSLNGGLNYSFTGNSGIINQDAWDSCGNGTVTINFYANNSLGNIGTAEITVRKDLYFPFITIITPEPGIVYGNNAPNYNLSISTLDLVTIWYSLNSGINYTISSTSGVINQLYWDMFGSENITITFYVNNSYGQLNFDSVIIRKDISAPNISIFSPQPYELFGIEAIEFNVSFFDPDLDAKWYTLNSGMKHYFTINSGFIEQSAWDACGNGTVNIAFFANNSLGNIGSAEVLVYRDTFFPFMELYLPSASQLCGKMAPDYNFSVSTLTLDSLWYTINSGFRNIIFNTEGTINQVLWESFGEGNIEIKFYSNNTYGQTNYVEVFVEKLLHIVEKNAYAIIIGISNYPGTSDDLFYCDDDAIAVYNMLINDYNFKSENIIYLQDSSATKADISNAFDSISSRSDPNDVFFFYYSGHGGQGTFTTQGNWNVETLHPYWNNYDQIWSVSHPGALYMRVHFERFETEDFYDYALCGNWGVTQGFYYEELTGNLGYNFWSSYIPVSSYYIRFISDSSNPFPYYGFKIDKYEAILSDGTHYLCSYDSIPSNPGAYYMDTLLNSKLDSINCADKFVIVDACNSGGLIPEVEDIGRYIMTACEDNEESLETSLLEHGIFTYFLLESKDNANDENGDGVISLEECYSYVYSNTRSYSGSFGSEYRYSPQESDGISGEAVLYPSIGSLSINSVNNVLDYSFYLYGNGLLKTLNITVCSISPIITLKTEALKEYIISPTGFGYYTGSIEFPVGYIAGGIQLLAEIEGNRLIVINLTIGDSDGDGLTDFFEILEGLNPNSNDTDSDGLLDGEEINIYGTNPLLDDTDFDGLTDYDEITIYSTDPLFDDTDSDGLLDGEEINIFGTDPLIADSDSDELTDGDEINIHFTDPLNNDSDSDNLIDSEEILTYYTDPLNPDTDFDGLTDYDEITIYSTDPLLDDTDLDGLLDGDEVNLYGTDPLLYDTDFDGLSDYEEVVTHNTNPLSDDTDSDTIPDGWEVDNLLDPLTNDTALDPDNDLLTNLGEYQFDTQPFNNDTDSDGLLDGEEVYTYNTDPKQEDTDSDGLLDGEEVNTYNTDPLLEDTDSDGLSDYEEVVTHNTNPLSGDTDSDTMPDGWEVINSLNPLVNDTASDPDNDLLINLLEYQYNTDPQNPDTDGDSWTDGDEVLEYDTDPLDPDDHPIRKGSPAIPGYSISLLISIISIVALILIKIFKKHIPIT